MRITLDRKTDAAYIYLKEIEPGEVAKTVRMPNDEVHRDIFLDFDSAEVLIGIRVLDASKSLPRELLDEAAIG